MYFRIGNTPPPSFGTGFYKHFYQYFKDIFISVVETKLNFFEIEMKVLFGNTTIMIHPRFSITSKPLHSVDVSIASDILVNFMRYNFVFTPHYWSGPLYSRTTC